MQTQSFRVVLDTNQIVGAGTRWLNHGVPSPDNNTHRRILIRVANSHIGLYSGKIVGEYLETINDAAPQGPYLEDDDLHNGFVLTKLQS